MLAIALRVWLLLPQWSDWWSRLCGLHCFRVQSFNRVWPWTPNRAATLWLSRPCRSRCHVACCWLRQSSVLLHRLFQLAIYGSACLGSLAAKSCSRVWTGCFPSPLLVWYLWGRTHVGLTVLLGPSTIFLLSVYTPFLLWQHLGLDTWDSAFAPRYA